MIKNFKILLVMAIMPLLLYSFSNCGGAQNGVSKTSFSQTPPFKIDEAYYQNWVAGTKEGGAGTNIYIRFEQMDAGVSIQNIYFRDQNLEAKKNQENIFVGYSKNEYERDTVMDVDPLNEAKNIPQKPFPFQLKENEAVIEYSLNGKTHYFKIINLSEKEMISYPQSNKNSHE